MGGVPKSACFYFATDTHGDVIRSSKWGCSYPYKKNVITYGWPQSGVDTQAMRVILRHNLDPLVREMELTKGKKKWGSRRKDEIAGGIVAIVIGSLLLLGFPRCMFHAMKPPPPKKPEPKKTRTKKTRTKKSSTKKTRTKKNRIKK